MGKLQTSRLSHRSDPPHVAFKAEITKLLRNYLKADSMPLASTYSWKKQSYLWLAPKDRIKIAKHSNFLSNVVFNFPKITIFTYLGTQKTTVASKVSKRFLYLWLNKLSSGIWKLSQHSPLLDYSCFQKLLPRNKNKSCM